MSVSQLATGKKYVLTQEAHHRKMAFDNEFIALLKKHGVEYDRKYVFD